MPRDASVERFRSARRRRVVVYLSAGLLAALFGVGGLVADRPPAPGGSESQARAPDSRQGAAVRRIGTVTRIVDGDTFHVSFAETRLRIWGLDAPELDGPGGAAATEALRAMAEGRLVNCEIRDIDRYGRPVGQCFLPGGQDITAAMIASGTAREYCRFSRNHYGTC